MDAEQWYELARWDRPRALRFLLLHDAAGLRRFAGTCASYLMRRYSVPLDASDVVGTWAKVGLLDENHRAAGPGERERAVGG